jgi:hypothetical protein
MKFFQLQSSLSYQDIPQNLFYALILSQLRTKVNKGYLPFSGVATFFITNDAKVELL